MNSNLLRQTFLEYFANQGHTIVPSSSLIPAGDQTLLFTNAGMVQFKDVFLGKEPRDYTRAVSAQRCVRAGGKHNDLENVGYTARHHTFFEMLGNFSFGDYFKHDAIRFAWIFLTEVLKLPAEKLWITVYKDDDEAADIWLKELKVNPERFSRCGEEDNFWSMGDTGPCGPCSEIFYDHGAEIPGGPPGSPEAEGDRYIEIWNLVFMQFNRAADGTLTPLPKPSVDTGMGLERISAVMQGVHNNYEIDTFRHLIEALQQLLPVPSDNLTSLRVIADHIRAISFLITDGVMPSNEGRGYVLRRIIRRAVRHGHKLGLKEPFLCKLVKAVVKEMGTAYPELTRAQSTVEKTLLHEEKQFATTLDQGMKLFEQMCETLKDNIIPGKTLFKLYDTYGFPLDLIGDIARERDLVLDYAGFDEEMKKQRAQSQAASQFGIDYTTSVLDIPGDTEFTGYEKLNDESEVIALIQNNQLVQTLSTGEEGAVVLAKTPFYAESGGQVGDKGQLFFEEGLFEVRDTQKHGTVYLHQGKLLSGTLTVGQKVSAEVDASRQAIVLNHSATHLLHAALRRLLGEHVTQKGSLVAADRLRFDFSHFAPLTKEEIKKIERVVNRQIRANLPCHIDFMDMESAKKSGAMALFNEKYGDEVRVLSMGEFSVELCGGTHVARTGDIGLFKIITETGIAAGVRRIEAITGEVALDYIEHQDNMLTEVGEVLKTHRDEVLPKLKQFMQKTREQEKTLRALSAGQAQSKIDQLISQAVMIQEYAVIKAVVEGLTDEKTELREMVDRIKQKLPHAIVILASVSPEDQRVQLVAGVSKEAISKIKAGELVSFVAEQIGGKGGGRPDMAQGGGSSATKLVEALDSVVKWVEGRL